MKPDIQGVFGIHHVTAIAGDPQANLDFYAGVLGLRLVKKTVNYDDPATWHFYYGDEAGSPGSILTFFPWGRRAFRGRVGVGQLTEIALAVPAPSLAFWRGRLAFFGVEAARFESGFGEEGLSFEDPDGIALQLVGLADPAVQPETPPSPRPGGVPAEHVVRGIHRVLLCEAEAERTMRFLETLLGFHAASEEGQSVRLAAGVGGSGTLAEVVRAPEGPPGAMGVGAVHHVAWRAADDTHQLALRRRLVEGGAGVTPVIDRTYFHSVYFHEPGGVLFEVATDPPGFTVDEPMERLGSALRLPPWLEERRGRIEQALPAVSVPVPGGRGAGRAAS